MDDYLSKPFSMKQLDAMLSRWQPQNAAGTLQPGLYASTSDGIPVAIPSAPVELATIGVTAASIGDSPLEQCYIDSIRMLDPDGSKRLLHRVVTKYIGESPGVLADILHAASISDMEGVFKKAHYLKSSSANLGAVKLAEHCKTLELIGRSRSAVEDTTLLTRLDSEFSAVSVALAALLQGEMT
jgi:HPt (histidine-containing phosphotransfer) domain-containing protein